MATRPYIKSRASAVQNEAAQETAPKETEFRQFTNSQHPSLYKEYDEFRGRIKIDQDRLDVAVTEQAEVFLEVCERHTATLSLRDGARDLLARKDSELAYEVRRNLEAQSLKSTESIVNDGVLLHPDRKPIKDEYEQLKTLADKWGNLRSAFEQRMRMLRELVNLYSQNYFTSVTNGGNKNIVGSALAETARAEMDRQRKQRTM